MVDAAERVGDPVLAAVADEQDAARRRAAPPQWAQRPEAVVGVAGLEDRPRLPVRALDHPRHDVLEAAERGPALARGLRRAEAVVRLDVVAAPAALRCHRAASYRRTGGYRAARWPTPLRIIVLEGDETGQELLEQALRVLDPDVIGLDARARALRPLAREPPRDRQRGRRTRPRARCARPGFGIKAATITPEGADDVGSPNRILREEIDGKVIIRTGRRIPGVTPVAGVHHPISVVRMAVDDAYGAKQWREGEAGAADEIAYRTEKITRGTCRAVAEYAFRTAAQDGRARLRRAEVDGLARSTRACSRRSSTPPPSATPRSTTSPVLIDATYAGLISGARRRAARHPGAQPRRRLPLRPRACRCSARSRAPSRCCSRFDDDFETDVAMAEAPHGTAPGAAGQGHRQPDGDDPGRRARSCTTPATARPRRAPTAPRARSTSRCSRPRPPGVRTPDLGGHASTSEFTTEVIARVRTKIDVWSSLGSTV